MFIKYPDKKIKLINKSDILHELYYNLGVIATEKYTKEELKDFKKEISLIDTNIPLFDIYSKNFYLINAENIYSRVINFHYRVPDIKIIDMLKKTLLDISQLLNPINTYYHEKLNKNINFINNYDLEILHITYFKLFYLSQPSTSDLTSCIKPSFIPFLTYNPYYSRSELINLALNMNLDIDFDNIGTSEMCKLVSDNDIKAQDIMKHQIYIQENIAKSYIQLYTLLGSYYWNFYLRNKCLKDIFLEKQISNLYSIIEKAPTFNNDYWIYRFIENDEYISHLNPGDKYEERSFISTTRNPFYDPKNNLFGFILIKIKIPKDIQGVGLCIEPYSMFPNEEEILLNPSILKLISISDNFHYYHPNPNASKRIKKLYIFEFIKSLPNPVLKLDYHINPNPIPKISWLDSVLDGDDFISKVYYFYRIILPVYNNKRYFYADIGTRTYLFQAFYLDDNPVYEKYFYLQRKNDEIYFILQDEDSGEILMLIELRDIISVNYIQRFMGSTKQLYSDNDFIKFLSSMARYFGIDQVIIHNSYSSYFEIASKLLTGSQDDILLQSNPDNHLISLYCGDFRYYNIDLINFMSQQFTKFKDIPGITYNLKKHHILFLSKINAIDIFDKIEKTPLFNILNKYIKNKTDIKLLEFYLYIHENFFYLLAELNQLIARYNNDIFATPETNPWLNSYFILKSEEYLYEMKIIPYIQTFKTNIFQDYLEKLVIENKEISFNKYRMALISN